MKLFIIYSDYECGSTVAIATNKTKAEKFALQQEKDTGYQHWVQKIKIKKSNSKKDLFIFD